MIPASDARSATEEVYGLLDRYFDALYTSDAELLSDVLHPTAVYATVDQGTLLRLSMEQYLPIVAARESPATRGEGRTDAIESIEFAGADVALARVRCSLGPKHFADLLSLLRIDGRWWVIAKVFTVEFRDAATPD